jgi:hypothetical protein
MTIERFEVGSDGWLEVLFSLFREMAREHPEITFSTCMVLTGVPRRLNPDAEGRIAWHGFVRNGAADLRRGEVAPDAVDLKTEHDWESSLEVARARIDLADPETVVRIETMRADAAAKGLFRRFGDPSKAPVELVDVHNALAERTL